jgi:rhamnose utilization protein RhaD (predicted bifunctional aldolase and dehydrogenase)
MPQHRWNNTDAQSMPALDGLVYRSRLLGSDRSVVNIFGGNTSAKTSEILPARSAPARRA